MIAKDTDTLGALFADEMSYTHSNCIVDTKQSYLKAIEERVFEYRSVDLTDTNIRVLGDTALVTGRAGIEVVAGGRQLDLDARYTVVWTRLDGEWRFLCWQSTPVPA